MNSDIDNPEGLELSQIDIHELLPQQEPFVMIDRLVYCDKTVTLAETEIRNDDIFVENGHLSACGLIENIAQTCAARIGYYNYIHKKGIQIGFIGAIRNMDILQLPPVGEILTTRVEVKEEVFGMTLAEATVSWRNQVYVTTEMKIAVKE